MPQLIRRFNKKESLKTDGHEIDGHDGDWTEFLVQDFCKIMSVTVPSFVKQSRQKTGGNYQEQQQQLDKQRAYDCHALLENILQKDVCIFE